MRGSWAPLSLRRPRRPAPCGLGEVRALPPRLLVPPAPAELIHQEGPAQALGRWWEPSQMDGGRGGIPSLPRRWLQRSCRWACCLHWGSPGRPVPEGGPCEGGTPLWKSLNPRPGGRGPWGPGGHRGRAGRTPSGPCLPEEQVSTPAAPEGPGAEGSGPPSLEKLRNVRQLETLARAYTLLALVVTPSAASHQDYCLMAYTFLCRIWQVRPREPALAQVLCLSRDSVPLPSFPAAPSLLWGLRGGGRASLLPTKWPLLPKTHPSAFAQPPTEPCLSTALPLGFQNLLYAPSARPPSCPPSHHLFTGPPGQLLVDSCSQGPPAVGARPVGQCWQDRPFFWGHVCTLPSAMCWGQQGHRPLAAGRTGKAVLGLKGAPGHYHPPPTTHHAATLRFFENR